ncbi:hypothetical protein GS416_07440 [Rhodococcus hoagii]|nr:hypothetical protein [Prescottella equi]
MDLSATVTRRTRSALFQFTDNGTPIGSPIAVGNGVATLPHTFTSAGRAQWSVLTSLPTPVSRILRLRCRA